MCDEFGLSSIGISLTLSLNEELIAISDYQNRVFICALATLEKKYIIKGHLNLITHCCFVLNDLYLFTSSLDYTLGKWNLSTFDRIGTCVGHESAVLYMIACEEGFILSSSQDGTIIVWNFDCLLLYSIKTFESGKTIGLFISNDRNYLISLQE